MLKKILTFGILAIVLTGIFVVPLNAEAGVKDFIIGEMVDPLFKGIGSALMILSSSVLIISGMLFDFIIKFTILDMAKNINDTSGIGGSINVAWATLRDVANMAFIFVLLYAAFKMMFNTDFSGFGKTVKNIIIIALLINFSLFFSKVVIDASNIVAIGFYKSIATANETTLKSSMVKGGVSNFKGISGGYMRMLGLQTWYGAEILDSGAGGDPIKTLILGIMSSIFMLVTAVIFLIAGIMFAARFIILIFLMILSPLAFIAFIIPGMEKRFGEWFEALKNQAFFAPLYFALTWVVFKLGNSLIPKLQEDQFTGKAVWTDVVTDPGNATALIINYVLIIGFSIAALVFAKQMATKGAASTAFKYISGGIGAGAVGGAAFVGRQSVGRGANAIANDKDLQARAARGDVGARMKLATAQRLAGSSFDVRGVADTKVGKFVKADEVMGVAGKASGAGGFGATASAKADKRRKPIDTTMRQFRDKPDVLAGYLMRQKPEDQQYMYDKLGARDRAALNDELDKLPRGTAVKIRLMKNMSIDEQEKTEKAGKDATKEAKSKEKLRLIQELVTTGTTVSMNPATGLPYTYADLLTSSPTNKFPPTESRKLSHEARMDNEVIKLLSARHLADLMANGDLDSTEVASIVALITMTPPYPLQHEQDVYTSSPGVASLWGR